MKHPKVIRHSKNSLQVGNLFITRFEKYSDKWHTRPATHYVAESREWTEQRGTLYMSYWSFNALLRDIKSYVKHYFTV